jgi:hypothetical protein
MLNIRFRVIHISLFLRQRRWKTKRSGERFDRAKQNGSSQIRRTDQSQKCQLEKHAMARKLRDARVRRWVKVDRMRCRYFGKTSHTNSLSRDLHRVRTHVDLPKLQA